jgi:hypothetical protein
MNPVIVQCSRQYRCWYSLALTSVLIPGDRNITQLNAVRVHSTDVNGEV